MKFKSLRQNLQEAKNNNSSNEFSNIIKLVNAGLIDRKELPNLKAAMTQLKKYGDVAKLPKNQRTALINYSTSLQRAALASSGSINAIRRNVMDDFEITDKNQIVESVNEDFMPPQMLVLKRTGIRVFPDGKRVALYVNDKLGLTITVPYSPNSNSFGGEIVPSTVQAEETNCDPEELIESFEHIKKFAKEDSPRFPSRRIKFDNGSHTLVSHGAARAIHMVHGALNRENKKKFEELLTTLKGFNKAAKFAMNKVQFKVDK